MKTQVQFLQWFFTQCIERPQTDHVITGPIKGFDKNSMGRGQTDRHTYRLYDPEGRVGENTKEIKVRKYTTQIVAILFDLSMVEAHLDLYFVNNRICRILDFSQ